MEITGKLQQILPEQRGSGKNGEWVKQGFVIETGDTYPKKVCITVWGDKIDLKSFTMGEKVVASIDVESREFNGKWYTDVKAWKVVKAGGDSGEGDIAPPGVTNQDYSDDDLPF
ncbi:DUF3127 domain-containing protein [Gynurincola endophyticus]|jgi:hypothetical protein|uniref:DUF3127 domain-containing protein n=1 Tax=Gynurincola endophyticus TaxID=2479004 RepID=UPI000F8CCD4C|nr:DUF3127 domain-containing protein [Gynurincola endophyticus]